MNIDNLVMVAQKALDDKYSYGITTDKESFGYKSSVKSVEFAKMALS